MSDCPQLESWQSDTSFEALVFETVGAVVPGEFERTVVQSNCVRFQSSLVILHVSHEPRDGEVAINFGLLAEARRHSFGLFFQWKAPGDEGARDAGIAWTPEDVRPQLQRLADALQAHGEPILRGDPETFRRLETLHWWDVGIGPTALRSAGVDPNEEPGSS